MKKAIVILISVSLVLILSGFAFAVAGGLDLAKGIQISTQSDQYKRLSEPQTTEKTEDISKCDSIKFDLVNAKVDVEKYDGSTIKLDYESLYENEWDYELNGTQMTLVNSKNKGWASAFSSFYGFLNALKKGELDILDFGGDDSLRDIKLYVPENKTLTYNIDNVNGTIQFNNISAEDMTYHLVNTDLNVDSSSAQDTIKINEVNGSVNMKNASASTLSCPGIVNSQVDIDAPQFNTINVQSMVNGNFTMTGVADPEAYSVKYRLVNGSAKIGTSSYSGNGNHSSDNGKYQVSFNGVNSDLSISQ